MSMFTPFSYTSQNVGKRIKGSKKKMIWNFSLDGRPHQVIMYFSKFSKKIRIFLDGDLKIQTKRKNNNQDQHPIKIRTRTLIIFHVVDNLYDLRVGNENFYSLQRKIQLRKQREQNKKPFKSFIDSVPKLDSISYEKYQKSLQQAQQNWARQLFHHQRQEEFAREANLVDLEEYDVTYQNEIPGFYMNPRFSLGSQRNSSHQYSSEVHNLR